MSWDIAANWLRNRSKPVATLLGLVSIVSSLLAFGVPLAQAQNLAQTDTCTMPYESVSPPLPELAGKTYVRMDGTQTTFQGGLYPGGSNQRPPAFEEAGVAIAATIQPLNAQGEPDPTNGRIGMISIGMSNTGQEFGAFQKLLHNNPDINPRLITVNGGVGGRTADYWVDPSSDAWQELARRLDRYQVSQEQVQVVWINLALTKGGDFPDKAVQLQTDIGEILRMLKARFPNLKLAYLSSRARSYTYWRGLSPEPVAFETGFAVKWLIEQQIQGAPELNFDPTKGDVQAPFLSWGPYFWVNGPEPRADGFSWGPADLTGDCTHPSLDGRAKIGELLLQFFMTDSTTRSWFTYGGQSPSVPATALPPTVSPSSTPEPTAQGSSPTVSSMPASTSTQELAPSPTPTPSTPGSSTAVPITFGLLGAVVIVAVFVVLRWRKNAS